MHNLNEFQTGSVTGADGTKIGYRHIGTGPGVLLVHGGLQSSLNFTGLAEALSGNYAVYLPDRRGRGLSGAYRNGDNLETEASDILSLAHHINARYIFALSSGAIIALQAAIKEPAFTKIALYEPPIPLNENTFKKLERDYDHAMRRGNLGKAFIAILKGTADTSFSLMTLLPAFINAPLVNWMIKAQLKNKEAQRLPLGELIQTFYHDSIVVRDAPPLIGHAKNIRADILLLGGAKSNLSLKQALDRLAAALPDAKRTTLKDIGHLAADNTGNPGQVAGVLSGFFR